MEKRWNRDLPMDSRIHFSFILTFVLKKKEKHEESIFSRSSFKIDLKNRPDNQIFQFDARFVDPKWAILCLIIGKIDKLENKFSLLPIWASQSILTNISVLTSLCQKPPSFKIDKVISLCYSRTTNKYHLLKEETLGIKMERNSSKWNNTWRESGRNESGEGVEKENLV